MNYYGMMKKLFPLDLGDVFDAEMQVDGAFLDDVQTTLESVIEEMFPSTALHTLSLWEELYKVAPTSDNVEERRQSILARLRERHSLKNGAMRADIYIGIAAALGYEIEIMWGPKMFRAGISKAGDPVYDKGALWVWSVLVYNVVSAPKLELLFNDIKPPYSKIDFYYIT